VDDGGQPGDGGAFTNSFFGTPDHNFLNVTTTARTATPPRPW